MGLRFAFIGRCSRVNQVNQSLYAPLCQPMCVVPPSADVVSALLSGCIQSMQSIISHLCPSLQMAPHIGT
uniref:Uncharacterized protein n=1 Tax=Picea glauca TaxID=3330 RepID=A0A117NHB4_PICGL|nr:hypothetical protein ABT39_MTgene5078 [Picea glauca]QHR87706.1 hypothetical protein Q903MT_gene1718 [Picea sitchensis]